MQLDIFVYGINSSMLVSPYSIPIPDFPELSGVALDDWYIPLNHPPLPNSDI